MSKHRVDTVLVKLEPWEHRFIKMKKEFKMTRNTDKRKHSHDENETCSACNGEKNDCLCVYTIKKYNALSCAHCGYDYKQENGILLDTKGENTVYFRDRKMWLLCPCDKCHTDFAKEIEKIIEWIVDDEYEYELSMRKIDAYLDRWH